MKSRRRKNNVRRFAVKLKLKKTTTPTHEAIIAQIIFIVKRTKERKHTNAHMMIE